MAFRASWALHVTSHIWKCVKAVVHTTQRILYFSAFVSYIVDGLEELHEELRKCHEHFYACTGAFLRERMRIIVLTMNWFNYRSARRSIHCRHVLNSCILEVSTMQSILYDNFPASSYATYNYQWEASHLYLQCRHFLQMATYMYIRRHQDIRVHFLIQTMSSDASWRSRCSGPPSPASGDHVLQWIGLHGRSFEINAPIPLFYYFICKGQCACVPIV